MKELNFNLWGKFKTTGELRVADPAHFKDKPAKVKIQAGTYEVLACSFTKKYANFSDTSVLGIVLKKPGSKLDFSKLKRVAGNFPVTCRGVALVEESHFKTLDLSQGSIEQLIEMPLATPTSKQLQGDEREEYGWWQTVVIKPKHIAVSLAQYDSKTYVYEAPGVLVVSAYPLDANFTGMNFHQSKHQFFKERADLIREAIIKRLIPWIQLKREVKVPEDKVKEVALGGKTYSPKTHKIIDEKIKDIYNNPSKYEN